MTSLSLSATQADFCTDAADLPSLVLQGLPVLILESDVSVGEFLADYLSEHGMQPLVCLGPAQAVDALRTRPTLRVALIDINHFPLGGFAAADDLLAAQPNIQIIYLSSMNTGQSGEWQRALDQGAHDIIAKPLCGSRLLAALERAAQTIETPSLSTIKQRVKRIEALIAQINRDGIGDYSALNPLISCIKDHDPKGPFHCESVRAVVDWLARQAGMPDPWCAIAAPAAMLHDLGMIGIHGDQEGSYRQQGHKVTLLRTHAALGHGLLAGCQDPILSMAAEIALSHHEQWGGGGYPLGLRGKEIPFSARLTAIADAYDDLRASHGLTHRQTVTALQRGCIDYQPDHFDPQLLALLDLGDDPFLQQFT